MGAPQGYIIPNLQAWRRRCWLTQTELAKKADVSTQTVKRAETGGSISAPVVRKLAAALGITPEQLYWAEPKIPAEVGA